MKKKHVVVETTPCTSTIVHDKFCKPLFSIYSTKLVRFRLIWAACTKLNNRISSTAWVVRARYQSVYNTINYYEKLRVSYAVKNSVNS